VKFSFKILQNLGLVFVLFFTQTNLIAETKAAKKKKEKRVVLSQVDKNLYKLKVFLNFENPFNRQVLLTAKNADYLTTFPIADKFEAVSLKQSIVYRTSLSMSPKVSYLSMRANGHFVKQFQMSNIGTLERVEGEMPASVLKDGYNQISVNILQEPVKDVGGSDLGKNLPQTEEVTATKVIKNKCFSVGSYKSASGGPEPVPVIWTQLDLQHSYLELTFKLKPFAEEVRSIYKFMFDNKNLIKSSVNFVLPATPSDEDFQNYSFMANIIGNILGFRALDFSISTKIKRKMNNVVIASRDKLDDIFKDFEDKNQTLKAKMSGNINLIRNPKNQFKGILLITGNNQKEIMSSLIRLTENDIQDIEEQNIIVSNRELPDKVEPFTAPNFMQLDKKYSFNELGIKTQTLAGPLSYVLTTKFKLYPVMKFNESTDNIIYHFNYIVSNSHLLKPVFNVFMNDFFVAQGIGKENLEESNFQYIEGKFSAKSLVRGENKLALEITTYPRWATVCGAGMIKTTFKDDSYIILPKGKMEVELPNLNYFSKLAFPFSIYPDLQKTAILITDFNAYTIASAMQIAFQLGEKIGYPGYYLTTTYDINKVFNKDIIVLGNQIKQYEFLYQNAPIKFIKDGVIKERDIKKNGKIVTIKKTEHQNMDKYVVVQTYRSPFNPKRIVLEISSTNPRTLLEGAQVGLTPAKMGIFKGDVWLYNINTEKSKSFRFKQTYKIKHITTDIMTDEVNEDENKTKKVVEPVNYDTDIEEF
jgi:hypothetical protein